MCTLSKLSDLRPFWYTLFFLFSGTILCFDVKKLTELILNFCLIAHKLDILQNFIYSKVMSTFDKMISVFKIWTVSPEMIPRVPPDCFRICSLNTKEIYQEKNIPAHNFEYIDEFLKSDRALKTYDLHFSSILKVYFSQNDPISFLHEHTIEILSSVEGASLSKCCGFRKWYTKWGSIILKNYTTGKFLNRNAN